MFKLFLVVLIGLLSSSMFAVSSASDLINVSHAILPSKGTVEYGVESRLLIENEYDKRPFIGLPAWYKGFKK